MLLAAAFLLAGAPAGAQVFGKHYPHGDSAVTYMYGTKGMFLDQGGMIYNLNRYAHCPDIPGHPKNETGAIAQGTTTKITSLDDGCVLHWDLNQNGEISDDLPSGKAFHEHSGWGLTKEPHPVTGQLIDVFRKIHSSQYTFWFDDNWVARYVSIAYGRPHPIGLHDYCAPVRFRSLAGDNSCWGGYPLTSEYVNQRALNGIRKMNAGDFAGALADWTYIKNRSQWAYVSANQRYEYDFDLPSCNPVPVPGCFSNPAEEPTYYYALWLILSERLLAANNSFSERNDVLQHAMAIRSNLLTWQLRESDHLGTRYGWRTDVWNDATVVNTETQSLAVLALGAEATHVFEPGLTPMVRGTGNYFHRPHNALSAVVGLSSTGLMTDGPTSPSVASIPPGTYDVDFSVRVPTNVGGDVVTLEVRDGATVVASTRLAAASLPCCNEWARVRLSANIVGTNTARFRVYWEGGQNLDVGPIRVIRR